MAVDFVLLDENDKMLGDAVAYRDDRTKDIDKAVYQFVSETELYTRTGIQKQSFNTILSADGCKKTKLETVYKCKDNAYDTGLLPFPFNRKEGSGIYQCNNYQLIKAKTKDWDYQLIEKLGYPQDLFLEIKSPGYELGDLSNVIQEKVGFNCKVILPPTHDTASAVMAIPTQADDALYISSGTWSLMGTELKEADCSAGSRKCNLTNEGGYDYRFRYLKNIMGLWMIQSVKKEIAQDTSFAQICEMAAKENIKSVVDANADRFLAPDNMTEEVKKACSESGQQIPQSVAEVAAVIYNSLAKCYAGTAQEIEELTGKKYSHIHVVGGGANAAYLNELTAKETGMTVYAGPGEATAIGNIASQMIAAEELYDLKAARQCIFDSFEIKEILSGLIKQ